MLILAYHTLAAFAAFPILQYDGSPLLVGETRAITLNNPYLERVRPQDCRMNPNDNYDPRENGPQGLQQYVRYYIKKRRSIQSARYHIMYPRYHFIVTRQPIDKALLARYDNVNPPVPVFTPPVISLVDQGLQEVVSYPTKANEFETQLGRIFCEASKLSNLRVFYHRRNGRCGIQNILVRLCLEDPDVNEYLRMRRASLTNTVISDIDISRIFQPVVPEVADTNTNMYELIMNNCKRFRAVARRGFGRGSGRQVMRYYLEGAHDSAFSRLIAFSGLVCPAPTWGDYLVQDLLGNVDRFNTEYDSTSNNDFWYLCSNVFQ